MVRAQLTPQAAEALSRLDKTTAQRILKKLRWLSENLDSISVEALTGKLRGLFKLRVGDYRVFYSLDKTNTSLIVHEVGHRREIYKTK